LRILSGIQPSGKLHIGNYFGAMRQHLQLQAENEGFYFIADYHALTSNPDPAKLHQHCLDVVMDYIALGLDTEKTVFWRQSDVPEVLELAWILSCLTPMGLLQRCTSYKDKVAQGLSPNHGLFAYPVLQAADILIFDSNLVPVGADQKQHIEVTRDIAIRFNNQYGETLVVPKERILESVAVVPGVDGRKMSKSYDNTIEIFEPENKVKKKVMRIVTDSTPVEEPKDTTSTVFQIWSLFATPEERKDLFERARAGGLGYGDVKKDLLSRLLAYFGPMRERRADLEKRPDEVEAVLLDGAKRAREIGAPILDEVRQAAGFRPRT
jgi:tryptophanyl-tRNA synthetase